ncbi:uncharacterized protein LOC133655271 [Entelurus aequoreus]|uniref:uncharacterized protein LOC133655271 n=1 Tax=Entelurus aequoreus TaxID=161455 RepID=UPI002B1E4550|nr:uncharacterized protein LOC133655271 [Entelurus aequoreus]
MVEKHCSEALSYGRQRKCRRRNHVRHVGSRKGSGLQPRSRPNPMRAGELYIPQGRYMLPLGDIIRKYGVSFHCYADDTQLYMPLKLTNTPDCSQLEACLNEIKQWMSANFLQLNAKKTEMLIIGPARHFDPTLSFESHIKSVTKTAFFHLRNIAKIRSILSTSDTEVIIHAFVTSRLDYCNILFSGLPMSSIKRLQLVQNAAARLLTKTRKFDHITPILAHLHWLPVHLRCDFKVLLLTYKILHGLAPAYLADCIVPYVPTRNLRSKNSGLLVIPRAKKKSAGYRAFSIRAPVLWNALPVTVRDATSVEAFKSHLKTHLYNLITSCQPWKNHFLSFTTTMGDHFLSFMSTMEDHFLSFISTRKDHFLLFMSTLEDHFLSFM